MTRIRSFEEAEIHVDSLIVRVAEVERSLRHTQKQLDTLGTPLWRRAWFRVQGWPPWWVVADRPARRPWRRRH